MERETEPHGHNDEEGGTGTESSGRYRVSLMQLWCQNAAELNLRYFEESTVDEIAQKMCVDLDMVRGGSTSTDMLLDIHVAVCVGSSFF